MSWTVKALFAPPAASMVRSNSPGGYFFDPRNIMCSKKCESPVIPGRSFREPTRKNVYIARFGIEWSGQSTTRMPLASVSVEISLGSSARARSGFPPSTARAASARTAQRDARQVEAPRARPWPRLQARGRTGSVRMRLLRGVRRTREATQVDGAGWRRDLVRQPPASR
jgi:hypothetical protein